uniref:Uncharacterized protein n=1 Tax=Panagrolaimus davidi TaxID=227884 RepID=A0A914PJ06_9BILA
MEQDSEDIIYNSLAAVGRSANKCVKSAKDADDEFKATLEVIEGKSLINSIIMLTFLYLELLQAALATQGHSEHRIEAAKTVETPLKEQDVDLKDAVHCLREGIQQLCEVHIAWGNIVIFFNHINNSVDNFLKQHIEGITKNVGLISESRQTSLSTLRRRILLREVTEACAVANVLIQSAEIYKIVHNNFVKPTIGKSIVNIGLTQAEAQARQNDIVSNFTKIKDAVEETIETYTQSLTDNVYDAMKAQGFEITLAMEGKKTTRTTR